MLIEIDSLFFLIEPMNILDLLIVVSFYLEIILTASLHKEILAANFVVIRALKIPRILFVFKFGKFFLTFTVKF